VIYNPLGFFRNNIFHIDKFMKELQENPPDVPSMIEGGFTGDLSK